MPAPLRLVQDSIHFPDSVDVVIIGAGIAGAATCWELTQKGYRVAVIEKGLVGAEQSSRNWGWCRQLNRDEREIPLIMHALQRWHALSDETGMDVGFRASGLVYATRTEKDIRNWDNWGKMAKQYGIRSRMLSAAEAKAMTPGSTTAWNGGVHSPDDGHADPALAAPGLMEAAVKKGALLFQRCAVRGLDISAGRVSGVITERGLIKTASVVCAAGAWTSLFCRRHGIDLPAGNVIGSAFRTCPVEQLITMPFYTDAFACRPRLDGGYTIALSGTGRLEPGFQGLRYAREFFPLYKARRLNLQTKIRLASFLTGPESRASWSMEGISPFEKTRVLDPQVSDGVVEKGLAAIGNEFPALASLRVSQAWGGVIDCMPDDIPVISTVPQLPGLILSSGYSGHGFGIGPGAGRLTADLVTGDAPIVDPAAFRYSRFRDGSSMKKPGMM
ncbi:NAD(P)/FAD-dependent oxidoreductase [Pantoea allii]|uniref:NAD(P)/FAD-dependent oxidoreductase n=1 Tax=Pantoea allii TaxID=574096 RepID=UPI000A26559F|nr:FAD-binding oxidoreductase [Pantoea allii]MBW1252949.1 FAD-binding oxidoreductase [Pantoea allii]MBW1262273.1 FAD-binding oxidoreductase [Pantoea allii]MBW1283402.1 FAD-binding oxidoreductase [Pantoea allii]ORM87295.1 D-amino-acid oxidase [Pantoea allii]PBK02017.1 D-amino-acid oxidase [Pantoea allii]